MSPESISEWCVSLAHCGVQGHVLRDLQQAIVRRGVDGKQFSDMLRSNTLQELGVAELNPRLCVAVRKAWHTDFAQITFVPHYPTGAVRSASSQPAGSAGKQAVSCTQPGSPEFSAAPHPGSKADGLADLLPPRLRAPSSFAPPQAHGRPPRSGHRQAAQEFAAGGLESAFAPRSKASTSFAADVPQAIPAPQEAGASGARRAGDAAWDGASLGDVFGARPPAGNRYAQAQPGEGPGQQGTDASAASRAGRHSGASAGAAPAGWEGLSLGDAMGPKKPARNRYVDTSTAGDEVPRATPPAARRASADASGWEGVSLGDAMAPKKPARNRYTDPSTADVEASGEAPSTSRRPGVGDSGANGWDGASLGDVMAPKQPARPRDGAADAGGGVPTAADPPRGGAPAAVDPWAGASLGDALGPPPKPATPRAPEPRPSRRKAGGSGAGVPEAAGCGKTPGEITTWLRTLPESHVPEQAREAIVAVVEAGALGGDAFTEYVQKVPPELCAPKHAMKLKAAWKNVLAEVAAQEICRQNLDRATNMPAKGLRVC